MSEFDKKISALTAGGPSQAGDEYVIARSGSNYKVTGANVAAAATSVGTLSSLTVSGNLTVDTNTLFVDATNNRVGIGTATPGGALEVSLASTVDPSLRLRFNGTSIYANHSMAANGEYIIQTPTANGVTGGAMLLSAGTAPTFAAGNHVIGFATAGTERMRIDASGNVGIGTGSVTPIFGTTVKVFGSANGGTLEVGGSSVNARFFGSQGLGIAGIGTSTNHPLLLSTNDTERARITAGGYFKASNNGTYTNSTGAYHELYQTGTADILYARSTNASPFGFHVNFTNAVDNNTNTFLVCSDAAANRLIIWSDGDVANHDGVYGTISDAKLKQDITDANSQWDDLKAIRFRKYRFKSDVEAKGEDAPYLLGVVAQELRETSPGLVDAHPDTEQVEVEVEVEKTRPVMHEVEEVVTDAEGVESVVTKSVPMLDEDGQPVTETYTETETRTETRPTGTETLSVKQSILLMKAAVALQEAMARIETLEARLAALEAK